jgi:hypothetical protein
MNKSAIIAAVKEVLRLALFAGLAAAAAWGTQQLSGMDPSSMVVVVGTVVLRFIDKYLHTNENIPIKGIAPF